MQISSGSRRVAFVAITAGMDARKQKMELAGLGVSACPPRLAPVAVRMRERTGGSWVTVMFSDGMGRQRPTGTAQGSIFFF